MRFQPQVKKEVKFVCIGTGVLTLVMWAVLAALHFTAAPNIPFDTRVLLGGLCGALVAAGCFCDLAISVQKVASMESGSAKAELAFRGGYTRRVLLHGLWVVLSFKLTCFWWPAAVIPLIFPRIMILLRSRSSTSKGKEVSDNL